MADNVPITPGSGASIATDDVGGVQYQRVKLDVGADGAASPVVGALPVEGPLTDDELRATAVPVTGTVNTSGNVAHDAADAGAPVKVGGKANDAAPAAVANADRVDAWAGRNGQLAVAIVNALTGTPSAVGSTIPADAIAGAHGLHIIPFLHLFNGATWDRIRGDITNGLDVDVTRVPKPGTAAVTSVSDSASSAQLLAATAGRMGFTVYNDSTQALYLKYGTTASATDFTVIVPPGGFYEDRYSYTGRVDGIWAADASGAARITELTA